MQKTAIIIQARVGSSRYPGKILKKISDLPLIEWVIKRVKGSKKIKNIILATTSNKIDDVLVKIAKQNKILIYRGENKNVLNRFYEASKKNRVKTIVRVCADNPFVDSRQIDILINAFNKNNHDYICNHQNKLNSNYADGFGAEIFSFQTLKKIHNFAKNRAHKEHITKYIWDNSEKFKILAIPAPKSLAFPKLKFDINTKKDFNLINRLVKKNKINLKSSANDIVIFKLLEKNKNLNQL